jgi:prepilin-type N-terminal cleavage/methylation domain-containing protein
VTARRHSHPSLGHPWTRRGRGTGSEGEEAERGFTIIELVVAMTIFAILLGAVAFSSGTLMGLTRRNIDRSVAANLASQEIDRVRKVVTANPDIVQGTTTTNEVVGGVNFRVKTSLSYAAASGAASLCSSQSGGVTSKVIVANVRVEWPPYEARDFAHATTEIAPAPGADGSETRGAIPVTVRDESGGALQGATVVVVPSSGTARELPTDADGCAYFLMPPGSYSVTVSKYDLLQNAYYVDRNDNPNPVKGFALPTAGIMPQEFELAAPGHFDVTFESPRGGTVPSGLTFSLAYWKYAAPGYLVFPSTGPTTTVGPLFPDGHQVWAGDCSDADPAWWGVQRPVAVPVVSRVTTTAPALLSAVDVTVFDTNGQPLPGATLRALHDDSTSPCDSPLGTPAPIELGTTDAAGQLRVALPFGHWQVEATGPSGGSASTAIALDPSTLDDTVYPLPPTIAVML